jgi:two-component system sensor histidine kinase RegB
MSADPRHVMASHLRGMWVALSLSAIFVVFFVQRVAAALAERDRELEEARVLAGRREKLASLATLAAGAAHELATPLSAIAVAARELDRDLARSGAGPALTADLGLIRSQVARCKEILHQMSARAGETAGEPIVVVRVEEWVREALDGLPGVERVEVDASPAGARTVRGPALGLVRALRVLVGNALQAAPDRAVRVAARPDPAGVSVEVRDEGPGMAPEVLARAGEPFFTTKGPGEGQGLGLFIARSLAEQLGGALELASSPGRGTTARIVLPEAARSEEGT